MHPRIPELLLEWEDRRDRGESVTARDLCADCPDLIEELDQRIRALESLQPVLSLDGPSPKAARPAPKIPGFEILEELGRGGMGVVYKARQLDPPRIIALKILLASPTAQLEARFRIEADILTALAHPNIVQVHEVGEYEERAFIVMEYCAGGCLHDRLATQRVPPREAARLIATLARAVEYFHERGIIHRDLKPGNVLLADPAPSRGSELIPADADEPAILRGQIPRIADFGLARLLDAEHRLTRSGTVMGTAEYMAPEQAAGRTRELGPCTDIWALGVLLYECLAGRSPFRHVSDVQMLSNILDQEARTPPAPPTLAAICLKCLNKKPDERYASAADLANDLEAYLAGQPVTTILPAQAVTPGGRPSRARLEFWVVALLVAISVVAAAWFLR